MNRTRTELKAEMMVQAEQAVDELLDWAEKADAPTLTEIEVKILKVRKRLGEELAQAVIQAQETVQPRAQPLCPTCQRRLHPKAQQGNTVESQVGRLRLTGGYYYCEHCRTGVFPPG